MTISNVSALNSAVFATVTDRRLSVDETDIVPRSNVIPPPAEVSADERPNQEQLPRSVAEQTRLANRQGEQQQSESSQNAASEQSSPEGAAAGQQAALTDQQESLVRELSARDREVRTHEAAHANVGGQFAGAVSLTFERGPDGQAYAVAGAVPIDVSAVPNDPAATIAKARVVRRAALAPSQPSAADRAVAAQATALEQQASAELVAESVESSRSAIESDTDQATSPSSDPVESNAEPAKAQQRADLFTAIAAGSSDPVSAQQSIDIII